MQWQPSDFTTVDWDEATTEGKSNIEKTSNSHQHDLDGGQPPVIDYEGSDYQSRFWDQGGREYEDRVEEIALHRLLPQGGDLLLELGAGAGRNTSRYKGFKRIVLLDYSFSQLQLARERLGDSSRYIYVAADAYRLPFVAGLFDFSTMIRTLHHLADPARALYQVRQVLGNGGGFILEYANKKNIKAIIRYLLGRQTWNPFSQQTIEFVELNYNFHPKTVRNWLEANNFKIDRQLTVSHFRSGFLKNTVPLGLLVGMDSLAQLSGDLWQFTPSVFVKTEAVGKSSVPLGSAFFRCPACDFSPLEETSGYCLCPDCYRRWEIRDGIYDFRLQTQKE